MANVMSSTIRHLKVHLYIPSARREASNSTACIYISDIGSSWTIHNINYKIEYISPFFLPCAPLVTAFLNCTNPSSKCRSRVSTDAFSIEIWSSSYRVGNMYTINYNMLRPRPDKYTSVANYLVFLGLDYFCSLSIFG